MRAWARAAAAAAALGVLTLLWHGTRGVDERAHAEYDASLRELRQVDRTLNQDVLRARFQLVNSYDPLVDSCKHLDELMLEVRRVPAHLDAGATARLEAEVGAYRRALAEKRELVESFKSRNSVLKNSLRYLPVLGDQLTDRADSLAPGSPHGGRLRHALRHALTYGLHSDEVSAAALRRELDALDASRAELPAELRGAGLDAFLSHARAILRVKPEVDGMVLRIVEAPIAAREEAVARVYADAHDRATSRAAGFRIAMYGMCVALFGFAAYAVNRLRLAGAQLAEANATLEGKVHERTRALDARNREMRLVLDNVDQGLLTLDQGGRLVGEYSAAAAAWLPRGFDGLPLWEALAPHDPNAASWLRVGWEAVVDGMLPPEVGIDQLPRRADVAERRLALGYRPIFEGERLDRVLVVVSDVTRQVELERGAASRRELSAAVERLVRDRHGFAEFFGEAEAIVERLSRPTNAGDPLEAVRDVHTLKGNAALFGVESVASVCHDVEAALLEGEPDDGGELRGRVAASWQTFAEKVRPLLGDDGRVEMTKADYEGLRRLLASGADRATLERALTRLELEPAGRRLGRVGEQAKLIARRLGKGELEVEIDAEGARFDGRRWAHFWAAFVHVVRNAVDHGVEPPEARAAAGKPPGGRLTLRAFELDGVQVVEIADDGRGIDWDAVTERARARGLAHETEADLVRALFRGGLSTRDEATEYSGRGVGLSAAYRACLDLGGEVRVASRPGAGTSIQFRVPAPESAAPPPPGRAHGPPRRTSAPPAAPTAN